MIRMIWLLLLLPSLVWGATTDVKSGADPTFRVPLRNPAAGAANSPDAYGSYPLSDLSGTVFAPASTQSELTGHAADGGHIPIVAADPNPLPIGCWVRASESQLVCSYDGATIYVLAQSETSPIIPPPAAGESKIEGFGASAVGGSGRHLTTPSTTVCKVTSLAASGAGSLKACVDASGPRTVVFETSGVIPINGMLNITNPYITIAGQTAPFPGITIKGGLSVQTSNVILQHLRVRGYEGGPEEGIQLLGGSSTPISKIVIDHCTVTWTAVDEAISTAYRVEDVTISNNLIGEILYPNFRAILLGGKPTRISVLHNVTVDTKDRHPRINVESGVTSLLHVINNLVYNHSGDGMPANGLIYATVVGNKFIDGPGTDWPSRYLFPEHSNQLIAGAKVFVSGNTFWNSRFISSAAADFQVTSAPVPYDDITVKPVAELEAYLTPRAGAWPGARDATDTRIVNKLINRTGGYITSESQVGGFPTVAVNTRSLSGSVVGRKGTYTWPSSPAADTDADGYTDLEEFLAAMATDVETL